ncbi:MAG TPA: MFS transporter [Pirellulales bacterium]|nr:MFS transporter [Pirellulales bacterium]
MSAELQDGEPAARSPHWKWYVCGVLLLATMLNYMDRLTLNLTASQIKAEFGLNNEQYGDLEWGFGLAFAVGGLLMGLTVDRFSVRWMYPAVLLGWSFAGMATAWTSTYGQLAACRILLGFFEAGQWPCALVTSQRMLSKADRPLGNSILQSGAALGAILVPQVVKLLVIDGSGEAPPADSLAAWSLWLQSFLLYQPGSWRGPFQAIGLLGVLWLIPWFALVRPGDLQRKAAASDDQAGAAQASDDADRWSFARRFLVLAVVVITINMCWHFFRVWMPLFLEEQHGYSKSATQDFTTAYYLATDAGCLLAGLATRKLAASGWRVHRARMAIFALCAALTSLTTIACQLSAGWRLLALLLAIGFGALGLFANYYSFTQELSTRHQGKVTGSLGFLTWTFTASMHPFVGKVVDRTHSYDTALFWAGLLPLAAVVALALFWNWPNSKSCGA